MKLNIQFIELHEDTTIEITGEGKGESYVFLRVFYHLFLLIGLRFKDPQKV